MSHFRFVSMLVGLGMMSACNDSNEDRPSAQNDNGTDISLNVDEGDVKFSADGSNGTVSINLPGFKGAINLPKLKLDGGDIDIDGVKLYPGSQVTGVNIAGEDGVSDGSVVIGFDADASPAVVQRYFLDAFKDRGVTAAAAAGHDVSGTDEDGKAFIIELTGKDEDGAERTRGKLRLGAAVTG